MNQNARTLFKQLAQDVGDGDVSKLPTTTTATSWNKKEKKE